MSRITIMTGADSSPIVRLKNPKTKDPVDLNGMTRIQFTFKNRDRSTLILDNTTIPATKAQTTYEEIIFIAVTAGGNGNDIILQFDGVADIDTIIAAWNVSNASNQVTHDGDGSFILSVGTIRLAGAYNEYTPVEIVGDALLGKVQITILESQTALLKRGINQSFNTTIDYGQSPSGTRIKGIFENLDVIDADL